MVEHLDLLTRTDKWFLGGGKGALYAPPFPKALLAIGFWDETFLADLRMNRLFCVLALKDGRPVRFRSRIVDWRPDRLTVLHEADDMKLLERRCVLESSAFVSELEAVSAAGTIDLFLWSLQDLRAAGVGAPWQSIGSVEVGEQSIEAVWSTRWPSEIEPDRSATEREDLSSSGRMLEPVDVHLSLGCSLERSSFSVVLAQKHDDSPQYENSVLPDLFGGGRLPDAVRLGDGDGLLHLVQHYRWSGDGKVVLACGTGLSRAECREALNDALEEPVAKSEAAWRAYFHSVPQFESSDPHLTSAYWYRWYGLRLNTVDLPNLPICGSGHSFAPFVTEGIGFFRNFITYSAQAHLREAAWMHSPRLAEGILQNLARVQRADGSFPGHNYSARPGRDFYHADFATGADLLESLHPGSIPQAFLEAFARYGSYFIDDRLLPADPNVYAVFDQNETGQEYMSRYQFASEDADKWGTFVVGGVDATTYAALAFDFLARRVGGRSSGKRQMNWDVEAEQTVDALLSDLYDSGEGFFCDLSRGRLSPARPATGFYPLLLGKQSGWNARAPHSDVRKVLGRWLFNPQEFWLPMGFPATALSDPTFSAEATWKEKRLNCPWNGRSWPMVNSHLVDAVASVSDIADPAQARAVGDVLLKAIRLMFHDGDPSRPNSYEHYNPFTGVPALYRGYDDYMHSWIVDLILRHAVGVRPGEDDVRPALLEGVEWIRCHDIPHPRGRMDVEIRGSCPTSVHIRPVANEEP